MAGLSDVSQPQAMPVSLATPGDHSSPAASNSAMRVFQTKDPLNPCRSFGAAGKLASRRIGSTREHEAAVC